MSLNALPPPIFFHRFNCLCLAVAYDEEGEESHWSGHSLTPDWCLCNSLCEDSVLTVIMKSALLNCSHLSTGRKQICTVGLAHNSYEHRIILSWYSSTWLLSVVEITESCFVFFLDSGGKNKKIAFWHFIVGVGIQQAPDKNRFVFFFPNK